MEMHFRIQRFDPERDAAPRFQTYLVSAEPGERVLDCLNRIRWEQDGTLAYRMSCAHGICGSDAMRINGRCALACQKLVKDVAGPEVTIEPLPTFRVLRDLIVDLEPFFEKVAFVRPYLSAPGDPPERERLQDAAAKKRIDEAIRCILCACCTAACPVEQENAAFLGPAALVRAFRYVFDSRDGDTAERLRELDFPNGVWGCVNHYECTRVCPKQIKVTKSINELKREIRTE
ncbi:MAG: succinate dehydrogenase iron-sulfur subunit [Deltaproteobacteria bacterium]|nr:succinate dehydrogenase iron-sulfur subunit [Deltaproteobacteria bacterium]